MLTRPDPTTANPEFTGLSAAAAAARLAEEGFNELPGAAQRGALGVVLAIVTEPMFLLLLVCGVVYLVLGDTREALMLLGFVVVIITITSVQTRKSERALQALRDLAHPRALVMRDGMRTRIAGRDVVRDDVLIIAEGDRVPADACLLDGVNVLADESLLTGESVPVHKAPSLAPPSPAAPGGDHLPFLYSGSLIVQGQGIARVLATGPRTVLGQIGRVLAETPVEPTRIQRETNEVVKRLAWFGLTTSGAVALIYGLTRHDWLHGLLVGITLSMATLPEELPVVLTIFLALGAWRIAQQRVLTRRVPALETLGATTVLCVDKTGTLTRNEMAVALLAANGAMLELARHRGALAEDFHELLEYATLASHHDPFDPMERAILATTHGKLGDTEHVHRDWTLVDEYPLSIELLAMSRVWRSPDRRAYVIAVKGAPEAVIDLCHVPATQAAHVLQQAEAMAARGLRVLGVAKASFESDALPSHQHDFDFVYVGMLGLADPVRPDVPGAIEECRAAGVRVVMLTGDHPATALSIARQIGLDACTAPVTGDTLDALDDAALDARAADTQVFCRVTPAQKLRLVNAFKRSGATVAMTGDGINDAPALRAANIGIAMGGRGTDVAREAADLVLLDDDFTAIVAAIRQGRRIFDNLRKAIAFVLAVHVPIVGMTLAPLLVGWPLLLQPVHVLILQLLIDPACSVVFEAEPVAVDVMRRAPRRADAVLFDRKLVAASLVQGLLLFAVVFALYGIALALGKGPGEARSLTFTTLILANLGLIFSGRIAGTGLLRSLRIPNRALWAIAGGTSAFLALALSAPPLRDALHFGVLHMDDLALCGAAGGLCLLLFEVVRRVGAKD